MKLTVNGQERDFNSALDGAGLLSTLDIPASTVVVELNGEIIPRQSFLTQELKDGDVLELVTLVGGG